VSGALGGVDHRQPSRLSAATEIIGAATDSQPGNGWESRRWLPDGLSPTGSVDRALKGPSGAAPRGRRRS